MRVRNTTLILCAATLLRPQAPPPAPAGDVPLIRSTTKLVQVNVIAVGRDGRPFTDLTKDDFTVTEAGKSYWDHMYVENRGDSTTLSIDRLQMIMRYTDPAGRSPAHVNHAAIPVVNWSIGMNLLAGYDEICLDEFARRSRYAWAGIEESDSSLVRMRRRTFVGI